MASNELSRSWDALASDKELGMTAITKHLWSLLYDDPGNIDYLRLLVSIYRDSQSSRDMSEDDLARIAEQMHPK